MGCHAANRSGRSLAFPSSRAGLRASLGPTLALALIQAPSQTCSPRFSAPSKPNNVALLCPASVSAFFMLRSSPRLISTGQLHALLHFHLRPIDDVVYIEPYSSKDERSNLRGSFTLRCLQRLSRPYVATQPCPWRDNWCTSGTSIPVLSY